VLRTLNLIVIRVVKIREEICKKMVKIISSEVARLKQLWPNQRL